MAQAKSAWKQMQDDPKPLERPLVVLGGIYDPGVVASHVADEMREVANANSRILPVSFFTNGSFESCAQRLIEAIETEFPSDDPEQTIEVDAIGFSMGGLVARYAACRPKEGDLGRKRLKIRRLFTIGTPHRGAKLAWIPTFDRRIIDMRRDSAFLNALNNQQADYEIVPYTRLGDGVVGAQNAAPPGQDPWWLGKPFSLPHLMAGHDVRILTDIARRLRGEPAFATRPPAPLP